MTEEKEFNATPENSNEPENQNQEAKPETGQQGASETQNQEAKPETGQHEASEEQQQEAPEAQPAAEDSEATEAKGDETQEQEQPHQDPTMEPDEDFDWQTFDEGEDDYTSKERENLEALYDQTLSTISEKEVVDGTVVAMTDREVVVNIGYKSEGVVSMNEFRYRDDLKIGDKVDLYVESTEDRNGQLVLSHRKARTLRAWERVNKAHDNDEIIKGYIKCRTKGGMIVDVFGIEAFLPGSQIDVHPIRDYDMYVGKTMEFKVVKINHEFKNVVVSHKALIEEELEQQKKEIISKLEKGQILEGTVKNITSYGVFVDLGGVDGLIHITDLSWGRVSHPSEVVELGQKINVAILDFDDDKKRIALGLKQLTKHPWDSLDPNLKPGDKVKGKVVVLADYGAFVEIAPGVEGLIHVSEMSWSQHLRSAQEFLQVGDEVEAVILTLDREDRKMSLGMKQLKPDPWSDIEEKYPVGSTHDAMVRNFTNFGVFVELEEGVDGLIHISDLSWTKKINHPAEFTNIGNTIQVKVLDIDKENRRLSLGHKQLEENPWDVFESIFTVGSIHEGTITSMNEKSATLTLPYGVEGTAPHKHLVKEDGTMAKQDEKLNFKVIEFNKTAKKIVLSHSRIHEDKKREADAKKKSEKKSSGGGSKKAKLNLDKTTLGDISDLAGLKEQMEEGSSGEKTAQDKQEQQARQKEKQSEENAAGQAKSETETEKSAEETQEKEQADKGADQQESAAQEKEADAQQAEETTEEKPADEGTSGQAADKNAEAGTDEQNTDEESTEEKKDSEAKQSGDQSAESGDETEAGDDKSKE